MSRPWSERRRGNRVTWSKPESETQIRSCWSMPRWNGALNDLQGSTLSLSHTIRPNGGEPASKYALWQVQDLLKNSGHLLKLAVKRGARSFVCELALRSQLPRCSGRSLRRRSAVSGDSGFYLERT